MAKIRCGSLGCECVCHRAKVRQIPRLWTPQMDEQITRGLDRGETVAQIAARLYLTEDSIRWRVKQLGRSLRDGWRSRVEVSSLLGVSWRAVDRWSRAGLLKVTRHGTRWTRVADVDLEAFVAAQAGLLFAAEDVQDARLRRLAETSALANRRRAAS